MAATAKAAAGRQFGILDTQDNLWMGTNPAGTGPVTFFDPVVAGYALNVMAVALGWPSARLSVQPYDADAVRQRDEVDLTMPILDAMKMLEDGRSLGRTLRLVDEGDAIDGTEEWPGGRNGGE